MHDVIGESFSQGGQNLAELRSMHWMLRKDPPDNPLGYHD